MVVVLMDITKTVETTDVLTVKIDMAEETNMVAETVEMLTINMETDITTIVGVILLKILGMDIQPVNY